MTVSPQRSSKPQYRLNLRRAFVLFSCAAFGCAIAVAPASEQNPWGVFTTPQLDWHFAFLGAASAMIVIGFIQEAFIIRRLAREQSSCGRTCGGAVWSVTWRMAVALLLAACLCLQLLATRRFLTLPEEPDVFWHDLIPSYVLWFCIVIALTHAIGEVSPSRAKFRRRWPLEPFVWIGGAALAIAALFSHSIIHMLVHVACEEVDAALKNAPKRYGLVSQTAQSRFAMLGMLGALAVGLAAPALTVAIRWRMTRPWVSRAAGGAAVILLLAAAWYCFWFYTTGFPQASPDMAVAGIPRALHTWVGGLLLALTAITVGACMLARGKDGEQMNCTFNAYSSSAMTSMWLVAWLTVAEGIYLEEQIRANWQMGALYATPLKVVASMLGEPDIYMNLAIMALSFQLAWRLHKCGGDAKVRVSSIDFGAFARAWASLAALVAVGIPTLAAASFSFWLGTWYRW
jgi:hypothetical protein